MIKIIKYWKPDCQPCVKQEMILKQLESKVHFELESKNILEIDLPILYASGVTGVPHLEIYWDKELLHKQSGVISLEKLLEILVDKLA